MWAYVLQITMSAYDCEQQYEDQVMNLKAMLLKM